MVTSGKIYDVSRTQGVCHVIYIFFGCFLTMYNCAKFQHFRIYVTDFKEGRTSPHPPAALEKLITNKVKDIMVIPAHIVIPAQRANALYNIVKTVSGKTTFTKQKNV